MRVTFWGVRGSIPAPGPETNRYGGNTSCVSVHTEDDRLIIIDMGTGLMHLGNQIIKAEFGRGEGVATVLLSHAYWDHIQGFPFFAPIFIPGNRFTVYGNAKSSSMLEGILEGQMNPNYSPIYTLKNLGSSINFRAIEHGLPFAAEGVRIAAQPNPHGPTTVLAFRLERGGKSLVYAPDAGYPDSGPSAEVLALYQGADILIHDSTYTVEDQATRRERGFSSFADAAAVAAQADVKHLVLTSYDQDYSDEQVDQMYIDCRAELDRLGATAIELTAAAEGLSLTL
ncbi:MAG: MBL fold metallo-hydrolase [Myxococcota bacterium]